MSRRRRPDSGAAGALIVDKPAGCTSHDVVDQVRRALGTRKVGHAGTLDPDATGVLVLGVGPGTKLLNYVTGVDKGYRGRIRFGSETSTLDAAGEVTATHDMMVTADEVAAAAKTMVGPGLQVPPMVSAVRIGGRRLHELAREGTEVERPPRPIVVHRFDTSPTDDPLVYEARVVCSSGTYIRSLAADLGTALGGGAHLTELRRTSVGPFTLDDACGLDELQLRPLRHLVAHLPAIVIGAEDVRAIGHGQPVAIERSIRIEGPRPAPGSPEPTGPAPFAVCDTDDTLVAIAALEEGRLVPERVLIGADR
ncbi:MAG: tRNA pseudouridine(55) synthase TruB [Acidimicrobiales bacterium]